MTARQIARRSARLLALSAALIASPGCAFWSLAETDGTFEDTLRTYAKLVRWGEIERASDFVDEDARAAFMALGQDLEHVRITDFDIGPVRFGEGGDWARVTVVYHAYHLNTLVEKKIVDEQAWNEDGRRSWKVRPDLRGFESVLGREPSG